MDDPKDDLIYKHQDDRIDRELKDKHRASNLQWEITARRGSDPEEDRLNLISGRLSIAETMLQEAVNDKRSYSEVIYYVTEKVLKIAHGNARALLMRALANSQLYMFVDAVKDAEDAFDA